MSSVDVVVPCYNYGRYLRACVGSILSQRDVDVRVLIIDDKSSDDSAEMMWGDVGRLYYWLHRDALDRGDWESTWMILQCS